MSEWFKRVFFQSAMIAGLVCAAIFFPIFQPVSGIFFSIVALFLILYGFSDPKYMFRRLIASLIAVLLVPNIFTKTINSMKDTVATSDGTSTYKLIILDIASFVTNSDNGGLIISAICILALLELKNMAADLYLSLNINGNSTISPLPGRLSVSRDGASYYSRLNVQNNGLMTLYINSVEMKISFFKVTSATLHLTQHEKPLEYATHSNPIQIAPGEMVCIAIFGECKKKLFCLKVLRNLKWFCELGYASSVRLNGSGNISKIETPFTMMEERDQSTGQ